MNLIKKRKAYIEAKLKSLFKDDDVFWNNEIRANLFVSQMLLILIGVLLIAYVLNILGIFDVPNETMVMTLIINIPLLLCGVIISAYYKGQKHWIKYLLCIIAQFTAVSLCSIMNMFVTLIIAIPVALSVRYYSKKLTITISIITAIGMFLSELSFGFTHFIDLNLVPSMAGSYIVEPGQGLREAVLERGYDLKRYIIYLLEGSFAPRLLFFIIIAIVCTELADRARNMVIEQNLISRKAESIDAELYMASAIQKGVLPDDFPPFPQRNEFDIYAMMDPAKEVGGDFYDFFMIDDNHLGLVIADVAGKGIPASLFMMISKTLIKTYALSGNSPAEVATLVNESLCRDNKTDMFVTAWYGMLEISSGKLTYVDAGHEYPALMRASGEFEIIKGNKNFVLGGMEDIIYKESECILKTGDKLFIYTDGVPEATDEVNELFGRDRMLSALNEKKEAEVKDIIIHVRSKIDKFVNGAQQFDDITMLTIEYKNVL